MNVKCNVAVPINWLFLRKLCSRNSNCKLKKITFHKHLNRFSLDCINVNFNSIVFRPQCFFGSHSFSQWLTEFFRLASGTACLCYLMYVCDATYVWRLQSFFRPPATFHWFLLCAAAWMLLTRRTVATASDKCRFLLDVDIVSGYKTNSGVQCCQVTQISQLMCERLSQHCKQPSLLKLKGKYWAVQVNYYFEVFGF